MKFLLHCQHLSGSGHFVRTYEIARALAADHEVHIVDGGWRVPRPSAPVRRLEIPRIRRHAGRLVPLDAARPLEQVMRERSLRLQEAMDEIRPDALVVDHFPFSKGSLRHEILPLLERTPARTCCSLRDIVPVTKTDAVPREETLEVLGRHFDALLVHGDPGLTRIEDQISWAGEIPIPIAYTGIVSERPRDAVSGQGNVVVSAGGMGGEALFRAAVAAWRLLDDPDRTLVLYRPPTTEAPDPPVGSIRQMPYGAGFLGELAGADLSISQAGYSTCANLLQTRVPAIVVPHEAMPDQAARARLLAERGLLLAIEPSELDATRLAEAMCAALGRRMPKHDLDLNGAVRSRELLTSADWPAVGGALPRSHRGPTSRDPT